eukprot:3296604-Ditylum_brightwellii.AAC.1
MPDRPRSAENLHCHSLQAKYTTSPMQCHSHNTTRTSPDTTRSETPKTKEAMGHGLSSKH